MLLLRTYNSTKINKRKIKISLLRKGLLCKTRKKFKASCLKGFKKWFWSFFKDYFSK